MPRRSFRRSRSSRGPVARRDKMWAHAVLPRDWAQQDPEDDDTELGVDVDQGTMVLMPLSGLNNAAIVDHVHNWHALYGKEPTLVRTLMSYTISVNATAPALGTLKAAFFGLSFERPNYDVLSTGVTIMNWSAGWAEARRSQNFIYSAVATMGLPNAITTDIPGNGGTLDVVDTRLLNRGAGILDIRSARIIKEDWLPTVWMGLQNWDALKTAFFTADFKFLLLTP